MIQKKFNYVNFRNLALAGMICFAACPVFAQTESDRSVNVTVYNSNLGVVRDVRKMDIKKGTSEIALTDVAQNMDPTTVHIKLDGEIIEQNYQYDLVSLEKILQKYTDKDIELINEKGEVISGKLLSSFGGQVVLQKNDGGLAMLPDLSKFRISVSKLPEGLITKPTLIWMVNSPSSKAQDVEITYQTGGMNWHAEYVAVLNEKDTKMDLQSWVSIENNCGMAFKDAGLKLVAGDVNIVQKPAAGYGKRNTEYLMMTTADAGTQFQEKEFFEYHIYNLARRTSLANNETKQISLFDAADVKVNKKYVYQSGSGAKKVTVNVEFENEEKNNLGVPMPKGTVRLYKSDGSSVEFIGEDQIDHTPKDEKLKLKIGEAFDLVAEEIQSDSKKISDKVHDATYEIKLKNKKKEDIVIDVERYMGLNWEMLENSIEYVKKDAQNITFKVPVKAGQDSTLKFKVRYSY